MAVLVLIIIIDVLLVIAVMYWGAKENLEEGHDNATDSKAVAALRAKFATSNSSSESDADPSASADSD